MCVHVCACARAECVRICVRFVLVVPGGGAEQLACPSRRLARSRQLPPRVQAPVVAASRRKYAWLVRCHRRDAPSKICLLLRPLSHAISSSLHATRIVRCCAGVHMKCCSCVYVCVYVCVYMCVCVCVCAFVRARVGVSVGAARGRGRARAATVGACTCVSLVVAACRFVRARATATVVAACARACACWCWCCARFSCALFTHVFDCHAVGCDRYFSVPAAAQVGLLFGLAVVSIVCVQLLPRKQMDPEPVNKPTAAPSSAHRVGNEQEEEGEEEEEEEDSHNPNTQ